MSPFEIVSVEVREQFAVIRISDNNRPGWFAEIELSACQIADMVNKKHRVSEKEEA